MVNSSLLKEIEDYINGEKDFFDWKIIDEKLKYEKRYYKNLVERVIKYYDLYMENENRLTDFLLALRCFLISFQTDIKIVDYIWLSENEFGLGLNEDGRLYASLKCPRYLDEKFISEAFQITYSSIDYHNERNFLKTNAYIKDLTGIESFYSESQKLCVEGVLRQPKGFTSLAVLPTGGGKSLITQTLAYKEDGLTIVIVPTVSLALDQEISAKNAIMRVSNQEIFSYSSGSSNGSQIIDSIKNKIARLLFISPEALIKNTDFKDVISDTNKQGYLKNVVIDEAHIVVEWGDFFRTDYQALEAWRKRLIIDNPNLKTVLLSATVDNNTGKILKKLFSEEGNWIEFRCDSLRKEPRFNVVLNKSKEEKKKRLLEMIKLLPHPLIVYTFKPERAETIKTWILEEGLHMVETFTGETTSRERDELIRGWKNNEYDVMVATSAFGMGVDKPDVRTVIHECVPDSANLYYQELGRGGRDGLPCLSILSIYPNDDLDVDNKTKVLSTDKASGRWLSMYNSPKSIREEDYVKIDTKIKPTYNLNYIYDEALTKDVQWNIYVILLLRRYNLIDFLDMEYINSEDRYIFKIKILDRRLSLNDNRIDELFEEIRTIEKKRIYSGFDEIKKRIMMASQTCISEMFVNTYPFVLEYCAGCNSHKNIINEKSNRFELVKKVNFNPSCYDDKFDFGPEALIITSDLDVCIEKLLNLGVKTIISDSFEQLTNSNIYPELIQLNFYEFRRIASEKQFYFFGGKCCFLYSDEEMLFDKEFKNAEKYNNGCFQMIHVVKRDYSLRDGKRISTVIGNDITERIMEDSDV